jgi:hypothetical protein
MPEKIPQSDAEIRLSRCLLQIWKIFHAPRLQMQPTEILVRIQWAILSLPPDVYGAVLNEAKQRRENPGFKEASDF